MLFHPMPRIEINGTNATHDNHMIRHAMIFRPMAYMEDFYVSEMTLTPRKCLKHFSVVNYETLRDGESPFWVSFLCVPSLLWFRFVFPFTRRVLGTIGVTFATA